MCSLESIVLRSKRVANQIWTLNHAQQCEDSTCAVCNINCIRTLSAHIKKCPGSCGELKCLQAKKMLAHYDACSNGKLLPMEDGARHPCLICNFVKRFEAQYRERRSLKREACVTYQKRKISRKNNDKFSKDSDGFFIPLPLKKL